MQSLFRGSIINTIKGLSCSFESESSEEFLTLGLNVKDISSIEQSFETFLEAEVFAGANQYFAAGLGQKIDARKSRIGVAPPILVVHLKRFQYDMN
jgi:ubiquitin C-terminal hydrolase